MKTAGEVMNWSPSIWASKAAEELSNSVLQTLFEDIDDKNTCVHCGGYIPEWDSLELTPDYRAVFGVQLSERSDQPGHRLCSLCEHDAPLTNN